MYISVSCILSEGYHRRPYASTACVILTRVWNEAALVTFDARWIGTTAALICKEDGAVVLSTWLESAVALTTMSNPVCAVNR